ncbi:LytR/AlgR family response regulator transcription factor [Enterococcus sp. LJL99]
MYSIFICDDNNTHLKLVEDSVTKAIMFSELKTQIKIATTNPKELVANIEVGEGKENIYFLDIDYEGTDTNGLQLGMKIREIDPFGLMIFITSHVEFGFLTFEYKLGAFDYIIKPVDSELLKEKIMSSFRAIEKRIELKELNATNGVSEGKSIRFVSDYEEKFVLIEQILLIETIGNHKLKVTTKEQIFECNGSLGKLEKEVPNYFFRSHRSYLVNMREVKGKDKVSDQFVLSNGVKIDCSRKNRKQFYELMVSGRKGK